MELSKLKAVVGKVENAYMACDKKRTIAIIPSLYGGVIKVKDDGLNLRWVMIVEIMTIEKEHQIIEAALSRSFSLQDGNIQTNYPFCVIENTNKDSTFVLKYCASANLFPEWINNYRSEIRDVFDFRGIAIPRKVDNRTEN